MRTPPAPGHTAPPSAAEYFEFILTDLFVRTAAGVLDDDELRAAQADIIRNPEAGGAMVGTGGFRKLRVALPTKGRGKSGGARVCYLHVPHRARAYFVLAYPKGASDALSAAGK